MDKKRSFLTLRTYTSIECNLRESRSLCDLLQSTWIKIHRHHRSPKNQRKSLKNTERRSLNKLKSVEIFSNLTKQEPKLWISFFRKKLFVKVLSKKRNKQPNQERSLKTNKSSLLNPELIIMSMETPSTKALVATVVVTFITLWGRVSTPWSITKTKTSMNTIRVTKSAQGNLRLTNTKTPVNVFGVTNLTIRILKASTSFYKELQRDAKIMNYLMPPRIIDSA